MSYLRRRRKKLTPNQKLTGKISDSANLRARILAGGIANIIKYMVDRLEDWKMVKAIIDNELDPAIIYADKCYEEHLNSFKRTRNKKVGK